MEPPIHLNSFFCMFAAYREFEASPWCFEHIHCILFTCLWRFSQEFSRQMHLLPSSVVLQTGLRRGRLASALCFMLGRPQVQGLSAVILYVVFLSSSTSTGV